VCPPGRVLVPLQETLHGFNCVVVSDLRVRSVVHAAQRVLIGDAAKVFKEKLVSDGIPFASCAVDDIAAD
jgi:hypothetical protein